MQRTLLSLAAVSSLAATLSAQCVAPVGTQTLSTPFVTSTTVLANPNTLPSNGTTVDPGISVRFDLTVTSAVTISSIGTNLWNDGSVVQFGGTPLPPVMTFTNLIGGPNGTMEVYIIPNDTVTNALNYGAGSYLINPLTGPNVAWTPLATLNGANGGQSVVSNLVYSAVDTPSAGTFSPPLAFAPGSYAVEVVLIPPSTAAGAPNVAEHQHPLITNLNSVPAGASHTDQVLTIDNGGVTAEAFNPGSLWVGGATPYLPGIEIQYQLVNSDVAYWTPYGEGCYDRKQSFYEGFASVAQPGGGIIDLANGAFALTNLATAYLAAPTASTFPHNGVVPGSTPYFTGLGTPTHVNGPTGTPGTSMWGDWDDSTSVVYTLPFSFPYPDATQPGGSGTTNQMIIGSNGNIWLGGTQPTTPRFALSGGDAYSSWLAGPPSYAVAYCDLYPFDGPTLSGGVGDIYADSDGASYVTVSWVNCDEFPNGPDFGTGLNFQITLEPSGNVIFTYGHVANGNSGLLVGYTPGNGAPDPGSGATGAATRQQPDLSVALNQVGGFISGDGALPAILGLASRPKVGNSLSFETTNVDPTVQFNLVVLSLSSLPLGLDLGGLFGMPGCRAYLNAPLLNDSFFAIGPPGGPYSQVATPSIPGGFAGVNVYAQAVQFSNRVPAFNGPNLLTSNAICMHFDNN